jgi:hypothetical protein
MAVTEDTSGCLQAIKWTWTSDSNGDAAAQETTARYNGVIWKLCTVPGDSDLAPTASYDVYVYDADSLDQLCGLGADRSATATEWKSNSDGLGVVKSSTLSLVVDAAGELNTGTVYVWVLDMDKGVPTI